MKNIGTSWNRINSIEFLLYYSYGLFQVTWMFFYGLVLVDYTVIALICSAFFERLIFIAVESVYA